MTKILKYELRIILLKPYICALTIVTLLYSYFILSTEIILGVSDTAPFSAWSFGKYMGDGALVSLLVTLLILAATFSERQKKVGVLTEVTGFSKKKMIITRSIIVGGYFLVSNILIFVMGCIFMKALFGEMYIGSYMIDFIFITIPCLFIILGPGNMLGSKKPVFIYIFMALIFAAAFVLKEYSIDINGANYFEIMSARLEALKGGETQFVISPGYVIKRSVYLAVGVVVLMINLMQTDRKKRLESE